MNRADLEPHELAALERDGAGAANDLAQDFARIMGRVLPLIHQSPEHGAAWVAGFVRTLALELGFDPVAMLRTWAGNSDRPDAQAIFDRAMARLAAARSPS